MAVRVGFEPTC